MNFCAKCKCTFSDAHGCRCPVIPDEEPRVLDFEDHPFQPAVKVADVCIDTGDCYDEP